MMTRTVFETVAHGIKIEVERARRNAEGEVYSAMTRQCLRFVELFKADNSRFAEKRFVIACGLDPEVIL